MAELNVYLFSGLGADSRVFQKLEFPGINVTYIDWITPAENETLAHYVRRLLPQITSKLPILIGLSFGGIVAVEVAKQIETRKVILLSSAKSKFEIPFYFRLAGKLHLQKLVSAQFLKRANWQSYWLFGVSSKWEKELLNDILRDTDPAFLMWAIDKIVHWQNTASILGLIQIHGTADRILPFRYVAASVAISGGGHLMTLNKAGELTKILGEILSELL